MVEYQYGAGRKAYFQLVNTLFEYKKDFGTEDKIYRLALITLKTYIEKQKGGNESIDEISQAFERLKTEYEAIPIRYPQVINNQKSPDYSRINYSDFSRGRHSVRHFSKVPVSEDILIEAVKLAYNTPSACNRQGWKPYIIVDEDKKRQVLDNQNGNKGFGEEISSLIVVTFDLRYSNLDRELYQAFVDGGMYTMGLVYALHYYNLATVVLSASLYAKQEDNIREIIGMHDAEVLISFIGVGNYADKYMVTDSLRIPRFELM